MIYLLGMSHGISVMAALVGRFPVTHENWNVDDPHPEWAEIAIDRAALGTDETRLRYFFIRPAMNWQARIDVSESGQVVAASPAFFSLVHAIPPQACVISFLGGNDHSVLSLVESAHPYDFRAEDPRYPILLGRQPIDRSVVAARLNRAMNGTVAMLAALRLRNPEQRIIHVLPPPPIRDEARILSSPEIFGDLFQRFGVAPISLRMKVYHLYGEVLASLVEPLRIELLSPPPESMDDLGALREGLGLGCTHGNPDYGRLVIQQLRHRLKG